MRVLVTGSTGFIGGALVPYLRENGHTVVRLARPTSSVTEQVARWDPESQTIDSRDLEGFDAVVHLAGENISRRRWSSAQKARIRDSRVEGTALLCDALAGLDARPDVFLCASALGYYGDRGDRILRESEGPGTDFLAVATHEWERTTHDLAAAGIRVAQLRSGLVLSESGGILARLLPVFRLGLGGRLASGRQYMSWISRLDLVRVVEHILSSPEIEGPVNASSPNPVTNAEFSRVLGRALHRPTLFRVPELALKIMQGQVTETVLASVRMEPEKLKSSGFRFSHPDLRSALTWALADR
jgi:uncharacterized protein (TIGR01777 family)